ncbi:MAG: response regulator transcription factor [Rhodoferax sp.]|nr:response regulator transcription factor [Rhodoferax sp.]
MSGTVYVVDDDASVLKMLGELIASIDVEVRTFASAQGFLNDYRPSSCQCLVCDLRMPEIDGIGLQKRLAGMNCPPPIIFLTGFADVGIAVEAMKEGAFDFVQKPCSANVLLGKIQQALRLSQARYAIWLDQQAQNARLELLTPKERMVVRHVLEGMTSREISQSLDLSVRTVENHRARIMEKLHVESTVDLVKLFK